MKISKDFNGTNLGTVNAPSANPAHWTDITPAFTGLTGITAAPAPYVFANASPAPVSLINYFPGYTGTYYIAFCYSGNQTDSTSTYAINHVVIKD